MGRLRTWIESFRSKENPSRWMLDSSPQPPSVMESKAVVTLQVSGPADLTTQLKNGSPIDTEYLIHLPVGEHSAADYTQALLDFLVQNDARPIYTPTVQATVTGELEFGSYSYWQPRDIEVNWDDFDQGILRILTKYPSEQKQKTR